MSRFPIEPAIRQAVRRTAELALEVNEWVVRATRPERLRVYLGHDALAVCRLTGRFKPVVRHKTILRPSSDAHGLAGQLTTLGAWLDVQPTRGEIEWIVGIGHVRYLLLPWDPRLARDAFCRSLTTALFVQSFGGDIPIDTYQLRFGPLAFGRPRLVSLIANDVIRELTTFSRRRASRARLIVPAMSVVWDHFFARMKKSTGVLALVEGPRLLRVGYDHGHVTTFSIQPFSDTPPSTMPVDATWIFPARSKAAATGGALTLDGHAPNDDAQLAYALCGVV
ncbi:hypothetical protein QZM81_27345 [Burkholderia cepacia]|uniref:hypothetical protein n=1 Tax=Burkholderia cepacia TaxID=292 RepID=UPI00264CE2F1|nr:hypothetical protein [Burkholderia cepacia]MDN7859524.1 hypothetical protein [Burkholderia cepacia]